MLIFVDGMKHWHKAQTQTDSHHYWSPPHRQSNPIDIEMTSYALLVYAYNNQFTDGLSVMKWITSQRNPQGGFGSTQVLFVDFYTSLIPPNRFKCMSRKYFFVFRIPWWLFRPSLNLLKWSIPTTLTYK